MSKFAILIVEDNYSFATELELLILELEYLPIGPVDNSEKALEIIKKSNPDLILMDINIKGECTGIEVAKKIKEEIPIIFITSSAELSTYEMAKVTPIAGYLVKPINKLTLRGAIEYALQTTTNKHVLKETYNGWSSDLIIKNCFLIKQKEKLIKVDFEQIIYLKSSGNYVELFTTDTKFLLKMTMKRAVSKLPKNLFVRIHKSYTIQINLIESINLSNDKIEINGHILPIGISYKKELSKRFNFFN